MPIKTKTLTEVGWIRLGLGFDCFLLQYLFRLTNNLHQSVKNFFITLRIDVEIDFRVVLEETSDEWAWSHILKCHNLNIRIFILNLWQIPEYKISGTLMMCIFSIVIEVYGHYFDPWFKDQWTFG